MINGNHIEKQRRTVKVSIAFSFDLFLCLFIFKEIYVLEFCSYDYKINRFKATKSRYYTFTMRYNHHLYLVIKHQMPFKETTMSFKQLPHFPHSLQSLKVPVLSFCMNLLFLGISHSIIRVTFCIWLLLLILLLLRFIQVVASISASLLFKAEYYIIV